MLLKYPLASEVWHGKEMAKGIDADCKGAQVDPDLKSKLEVVQF